MTDITPPATKQIAEMRFRLREYRSELDKICLENKALRQRLAVIEAERKRGMPFEAPDVIVKRIVRFVFRKWIHD